MKKEMLINTVEGQECRIAIVCDGQLEELYVERTATASHVGNIYKARVTNVEPAIQAAFVEVGLGKNGFLHVSDINPSHFPKSKKGIEQVGRKRPHYVRPPIQECLRRGQELVVQMTKEGIGTKGPTMTTYLSIPGRLLVMMPGMSRLGVSRKVEDEAARGKARAALAELKLPSDIGFIVRTAGVDRPKRELQRDLNYLLRLWKAVKQRIRSSRSPVELYRESDLVTRTIRDVYNSDITRVICDSAGVARRVDEFLSVAVPRSKHRIELYTGKEGLFYDYGLDEEIERIYSRRVELRSGGSLVIDQAEALVAIDVNSGRYRQHSDAETTALKINVEAAAEVVRQLRLRDLGGVIIIDFIDMREERNSRELERTLRDALKNDRAKTKVLRSSAFGIIELTRQRLGPSLKQSVYDRCSHCDGMGVIKSQESLSLSVMRNIQRACARDDVFHVEVLVPPQVAHYLGNYQRRQLTRIEAETGKTVIIRAETDIGAGTSDVRCTNSRGTPVAWDQPSLRARRDKLPTIQIADLPPPPANDKAATPGEEPGKGAPGAPAAATTPGAAGAAATAGAPGSLGEPVQPPTEPDFGTEEAFEEAFGAAFEEAEGDVEDEAEGEAEREPEGPPAAPQGAAETPAGQPGEQKRGRRGRRGGRKHRRRHETAQAQAATSPREPQPPGAEPRAAEPSAPSAPPEAPEARASETPQREGATAPAAPEAPQPPAAERAPAAQQAPAPAEKKPRRRRRRRPAKAPVEGAEAAANAAAVKAQPIRGAKPEGAEPQVAPAAAGKPQAPPADQPGQVEGEAKPKRRRRRRKKPAQEAAPGQDPAASAQAG